MLCKDTCQARGHQRNSWRGLYLPCSFSFPAEQAAQDTGQCLTVRYNFIPQVTQIEIFYIQRYDSYCHNWEKLLASREQRPRITLNILQCTGQSPTIRNIQAETSLILLGQNLFQIMVKQKENEEVPKVCLTKQPTGKRQMWKTFHRKETQMENKTRKNWNLVSKQGTQIMVRHHFTLN